MKTTKWLKCSFSSSIKSIFEVLDNHEYSEDIGRGFAITSVRDESLSGKFIQKKTVLNVIDSPFSESYETKTIVYETIVFTILKDSEWHLEIDNPSRTIRPLLNELFSLFGLGFYVSELSINLYDLLLSIDENFGNNKVDKIEISDINIENKAIGNLVIQGESDVRELIKNKLIGHNQFKYKSFRTYLLAPEYLGGWVEVRYNATVKIHNIPPSIFTPKFRKIILSENVRSSY